MAKKKIASKPKNKSCGKKCSKVKSGDDCPDNVCPIKKKSPPKKKSAPPPPETKEQESWFRKVLNRFGL